MASQELTRARTTSRASQLSLWPALPAAALSKADLDGSRGSEGFGFCCKNTGTSGCDEVPFHACPTCETQCKLVAGEGQPREMVRLERSSCEATGISRINLR